MPFPNRVIKKGETDKNIVKLLQIRLNELGVSNLVVDGIFELQTERAVKLFQARSLDIAGRPLLVDGKVGSITYQALFKNEQIPTFAHSSPFINSVLSIAISQIDVVERPLYSNSGPEVDGYLRSTNLGPGFPWCMSFVYWCFQGASNNLGISNPLVKTAGCLEQWNRSTLQKINNSQAVNNPSLIKPGSIFIMDFGGGKGHTGIVETISGGYINTIEGNTSTSQTREGIGVFRASRKINSVNKGFILVS